MKKEENKGLCWGCFGVFKARKNGEFWADEEEGAAGNLVKLMEEGKWWK